MKNKNIDVMSIEAGVKNLVFDLSRALPPDCATISVVDDPKSTGGGIIVSLTPVRPSAAKIVAHVQNGVDVVEIIIGRGAVFEVPLKGKRYTELACFEEIRLLCSAVIGGEFEETIWLKGSEVIKAIGKLKLGGKIITSRWTQLFINPFSKTQKVHLSYTPY